MPLPGGHLLRAQSAAGVCSTCLASDRVLYSFDKTPDYLNICNGLILTNDHMVCYECRARLSNFVKFRSQALHVNNILLCIPSRCWVPQPKFPGIECLSTLTQTVISPDETIYIHDDLLPVKQETVHSELEIKEEEEIVAIQPLPDCSNDLVEEALKTDGEQIPDEDFGCESKPEPGDKDDEKSDTASEDGKPVVKRRKKPWQLQDSLITSHFTVRQLDHSEVLSEMEKEKASSRYQKAQYKCDKCAVVLRLEPLYRSHIDLHREEQGPFQCKVCEQRFKYSVALKQHTATHYTRYQCQHCELVKRSYNQIYFHYRSVHDNSSRLCTHCHKSFTSKRELKMHRRREHGRRHPCASCGRQYATSEGLQRHMLVHDKTVPELECVVCHKKYKGEYNLKTHIYNVHEMHGSDAYCAECDMQFKTRNQYQRHLNTGRHVPVEDYRFECDYCGQRCVVKETLRTHIEQKHLKLRQYKCPLCDESFHTKWRMGQHKRLKHRAQPPPEAHVCYICEKSFKRRKSLAEHMNTHLGVRPFECKQCDATFAWSAALYNHTQIVHLKKKRGKHKHT